MVVTTGDKRKLLVAACDKHPGCELLVGVLVATDGCGAACGKQTSAIIGYYTACLR